MVMEPPPLNDAALATQLEITRDAQLQTLNRNRARYNSSTATKESKSKT